MADPTLKTLINNADHNSLSQQMKLLGLGTYLEALVALLTALLTVTEYDTGTISATAEVTLPEGAILVQSAHVVTSGTAASVGHYHAGNSTSTPLLPPGGANTAVGIASVAADGTTITFPNTVTRVIVRYLKKPTAAQIAAATTTMSTALATSPPF